MFTRHVKVQISEKYFFILSTQRKVPTQAGNKHLSIHLLPYSPCLFHLSPEMDIRALIPTPKYYLQKNTVDQYKTLLQISCSDEKISEPT